MREKRNNFVVAVARCFINSTESPRWPRMSSSAEFCEMCILFTVYTLWCWRELSSPKHIKKWSSLLPMIGRKIYFASSRHGDFRMKMIRWLVRSSAKVVRMECNAVFFFECRWAIHTELQLPARIFRFIIERQHQRSSKFSFPHSGHNESPLQKKEKRDFLDTWKGSWSFARRFVIKILPLALYFVRAESRADDKRNTIFALLMQMFSVVPGRI